MKKLSKAQWQERIIHLAKTLPKDIRPDDQTLLSLLMEVILAEQAHLRPQHLATLTGIAAVLLERFKTSIPAATHVTTSGEKVYTEAEVAAHLGISLEEVRRVGDEMAKDLPNDGLVYADVDPATLHRVN